MRYVVRTDSGEYVIEAATVGLAQGQAYQRFRVGGSHVRELVASDLAGHCIGAQCPSAYLRATGASCRCLCAACVLARQSEG